MICNWLEIEINHLKFDFNFYYICLILQLDLMQNRSYIQFENKQFQSIIFDFIFSQIFYKFILFFWNYF